MNSAQYVAAVDQGTTSTRCLLVDHRGRMVAVSQREHRQYYPRSGWVEHDAAEIWRITQRCIQQALSDVGAGPENIAGLGITNQRETTVLWDRHTGHPVHRAITWQDTRTAPLLESIAIDISPGRVQQLSGTPLVSYFAGPKVRWLLDNDPALQTRAEHGDVLFGTMDSWLIWNLTGGPNGGLHVTDPSNASRTMMMNIETLQWDDELLQGLQIPRAMLPEIVPSMGPIGHSIDPVPGIPITGVIGDQQASLLGQTAFDPGEAKCTFGTGSFMLLNTGTNIVRSQHGLVTTVAYLAAGQSPVYALEGSVAVAGSLVQWCRDNLGIIRSAAEIETYAASVEDSGGCTIVPAFAGLFAPHWETEARGTVLGLTSFVTRAHLCRAMLESVAWQTRDVFDAMTADAGAPLTRLAVDGGMTANNLLMQCLADFLDVTVVRPVLSETVALGAAYAAGLGSGFWPDISALRRNWRVAARWEPEMDAVCRAADHETWKTAVRVAISWANPTGRRRMSAPVPEGPPASLTGC